MSAIRTPVVPARMHAGEIHIWWLELKDAAEWRGLLGDEERARAARFRFERHRERYIAAHGQVRQILGRLVDQPPQSLEFHSGFAGKPSLAGGDIEFNLSHSDEYGLLAVTVGAAVGVDLERRREDFEGLDLARRFFTGEEVTRLESVGGSQRTRLFFQLWTAKEAFMKATGEGFSRAPDSFEMRFGGNGDLVGLRGERGWRLQALEGPDGFSAAVCAQGEGAFSVITHP